MVKGEQNQQKEQACKYNNKCEQYEGNKISMGSYRMRFETRCPSMASSNRAYGKYEDVHGNEQEQVKHIGIVQLPEKYYRQ